MPIANSSYPKTFNDFRLVPLKSVVMKKFGKTGEIWDFKAHWACAWPHSLYLMLNWCYSCWTPVQRDWQKWIKWGKQKIWSLILDALIYTMSHLLRVRLLNVFSVMNVFEVVWTSESPVWEGFLVSTLIRLRWVYFIVLLFNPIYLFLWACGLDTYL